MISVIDTNESVMIRDPFEGMSMAEVCGLVESSVNEICNEFEMNILLTEHAYLYENGTEMSYMDEAGNLNENGISLIEKAKSAIQSFAEWVNNALDSAAAKISQWASGVVANLSKVGISKKHVNSVISNYSAIFGGKNPSVKVRYDIDDGFFGVNGFVHAISTSEDAAEKLLDPETFYKFFVHEKDGETSISADDLNNAYGAIFNSTLIKDIKTAKKEANTILNNRIKQLKSAAKSDDLNEKIANLKAVIKHNTKITTRSIKIANLYAINAATIIKGVLKTAEVKKWLRDGRAEFVKTNASDAANKVANSKVGKGAGHVAAGVAGAGSFVGAAAKDGANTVKNSKFGKTVGGAVSGAASGAKEKLSGVAKNFTKKNSDEGEPAPKEKKGRSLFRGRNK